jgi:hypothetical protein
MAATGIPGAGLRGVLRLTWAQDRLAHVLEHCGTDEPPGTWTGLACPDHGLAIGADVDTAALLTWPPHTGSYSRPPSRRITPEVPSAASSCGSRSAPCGRRPGRRTAPRWNSCSARA